MSPDDHRHGTYAGRKKHIKDGEAPCDACKAAAAKYQNLRELDAMRGRPRAVSTTGAVRRVQALMALGWTNRDIADRLGVHRSQVHKWTKNGSYVRRDTLTRISAVYEELSMKLPPAETTQEKRDSSYARTVARRNGWLPPLAWLNIDDPDEQPTDWQYRAPTRAETLEDLDERQAGISEVCRVLDVDRKALQRWCARHGHGDLFARLMAREAAGQVYRNQYSREAS